jgi:hypothetical protein
MKTWKVPIILGMVVAVLLILACSVSNAFAEEPPNPYCTWVEPTTETITVVDHEAYDETIPGECYPAETHNEWVCTRRGPFGFCWRWECVTVVDQEAYCDPDTVVHHDAVTHEETVTIEEGYWDCPELCQYNQDIPADDPKCKAPEECKWTGTGFGLFLLEGPDGQLATMYVYEDENGDLPIGIGVERQKCVLGWVAVNTPFHGKVERDTCTGAFRWNDQVFFPRADVLEDGVCQRNGECLDG